MSQFGWVRCLCHVKHQPHTTATAFLFISPIYFCVVNPCSPSHEIISTTCYSLIRILQNDLHKLLKAVYSHGLMLSNK